MLIGPLDEALGLLQNLVSRRFEYQADNFAVEQGYAEDLKGALCILDKSNKGPPNTDRLYSIYHHSHPTLRREIGRGGSNQPQKVVRCLPKARSCQLVGYKF